MEKISSITNTNNNEKKLIIRTLGSTEDVNKAMTLYEYDDELLVIDCGLGYPDIFDMPGVDVLIPDFTYLLENSHKIKGLFLTHAHEDHIGAVPYLLQELPEIPIYASQLVVELLKSKLKEKNFKNLAESTHFHVFDPKSPKVVFKNISVSSIGVNHSVPEAQGFAIETPEGKVLHIAEYKFDDTPVIDKPIDVETIKRHADEGVLCLISDCLLVGARGSTKSEKTLDQTFFDIFEKAGNKQVFITVISSNVSRMYQIANAALKYGRKIVFSGRSIETVGNIARSLGYLPFPDDMFVLEQDASKFDQGALVYIIAGCYGQPGSSLGKVSRQEHKDITLEKDAVVVFSGDPSPPGSEITVEKMTDTLVMAGAEIVDRDIQENLHVSGHGVQEDIIRMARLVHPKYFIPVGGTITKVRKYKTLMEDIGFNEKAVFECLEGDSVEFYNGMGKKGESIELEPVYISTGRADEIDPRVIQDREILCKDGVFVVVVGQDRKTGNIKSDIVDVVTRGFIFVKDSKELMDQSRSFITKTINKRMGGSNKGWNDVRRGIEKDIDRFLYKKTGRTPLIIVHALPM